MSATELIAPLPEEDDLPPTWGVLERLGRALHVKEAGLEPTLDAILRVVVDVVDPAEAAGVNLYVRGVFVPQQVFGSAPHRIDLWQQQHHTGPCIDASRDQTTVRVDDTAGDPRWPGLGDLAASLGVCSMLCVPLWVDDTRLGSLSLYAGRPGAFADRDERLAGLVATQAALALADAQRTEQLRTMAHNRDLIGQAKGILMALHKVTADEAFDLLRTSSQQTNRKLLQVAETVVETGTVG